MHRSITTLAIAVAGLPLAAAHAHEWTVQLSNPVLTPANPSTEVILNPGYRTDCYALAGVAWSTHVTEPGWDPASFEALITHPGQTVGELSPGGLSITGQSAGQLYAFGFVPSPPFPDVWRGVFTVTDFSAAREITLTTETSRYDGYLDDSSSARQPLPLPAEARAVIQVVPAPAPLALLGLGSLAATRRRRRREEEEKTTTARRPARRGCCRSVRPIAANAATAVFALSAFALLGATAPAASAQSWEFRFSEEILSPATPSTTVTLWASFPPTDWAFAGAWLDLEASEPRWSDLSALLTGQPGQMPGEIQPDGRRVTDIRVGQLIGFGRTPDPSNPIAVWQATFTATDFSRPREVLFSTTTERFQVYPTDPPTGVELRTPIDIEAAIRVVPAPAPVALLGLAVVTGARRRRPPARAVACRTVPAD